MSKPRYRVECPRCVNPESSPRGTHHVYCTEHMPELRGTFDRRASPAPLFTGVGFALAWAVVVVAGLASYFVFKVIAS